jgi:2'-5' RNA ligase
LGREVPPFLITPASGEHVSSGTKAEDTDTSVCIVALPAAGSALPGGEEKHATILYFGDWTKHPGTLDKQLLANVCTIAARECKPFTAQVTKIQSLGDNGAQVWMLDAPELHRLFDDLQDIDSEVHSMYVDADVTRYPKYRPHVTIGYDTGSAATSISTEDVEEAQTVKQIKFDRIGLWWGKERYEFTLGMEAKEVRHVRDASYWGQPVGSVIVGNSKTRKVLKELTSMDPEYNGSETMMGSDKQKYHIGKNDKGEWVAIHDGSHKTVVTAPTEESAYRQLNAQLEAKKAKHRATAITGGAATPATGPRKPRKRVLTASQREAVLGVNADGSVDGTPDTLRGLRNRGLIARDGKLTKAGLETLTNLGGSIPGADRAVPDKPVEKPGRGPRNRTGEEVLNDWVSGKPSSKKTGSPIRMDQKKWFESLNDDELDAVIKHMRKTDGWHGSLIVAKRVQDIRSGEKRALAKALREAKWKPRKGDKPGPKVQYTDDNGNTTIGEIIGVTKEGNYVVSNPKGNLIRKPEVLQEAPDTEVKPGEAVSPSDDNVFGGIRGRRPYTVVKLDRDNASAKVKATNGDLLDVSWTIGENAKVTVHNPKTRKTYTAPAGSSNLRHQDRVVERERVMRQLLKEAQGGKHVEAWPPRGPKGTAKKTTTKKTMVESAELSELANLRKVHPEVRKGTPDGDGTKRHPIDVHGDLDLAQELLSQGKHVRLNTVDDVGTLLDKLASRVKQAERMGDKAPTYDLCKVSVPKTNLFCARSKGIPRTKMPQLGGIPVPGSLADKLPRDKKGEVNIADAFREELKARGIKSKIVDVKAAWLKASQANLDGPKVAGMSKAMKEGKVPDAPIFVTSDGYIIDGHHRWASKVAIDAEDGHLGDIEMPVEMLDMEIGEALDFTNAFALAMGIKPKGLGAAAEGVAETAKKATDYSTWSVADLQKALKTARGAAATKIRAELARRKR